MGRGAGVQVMKGVLAPFGACLTYELVDCETYRNIHIQDMLYKSIPSADYRRAPGVPFSG